MGVNVKGERMEYINKVRGLRGRRTSKDEDGERG
jgi:hypothetical protein